MKSELNAKQATTRKMRLRIALPGRVQDEMAWRHERPARSNKPYDAPRINERILDPGFISCRVNAPARREELDVVPMPAEPLPEVSEPEWIKMKERLGREKSEFDKLSYDDFSRFSRNVDLLAGLKSLLRGREVGMQLCTNASLKISELLVEMDLLPRDTKELKAFCNAELPGAFIIALNHYIFGRYKEEQFVFDWVASSFLPQIDGDMLEDTYQVYARNRSHWLMGPSPNALPPGCPPITGDVTDAEGVKVLASAVKARYGGAGANLYTSDIGADASSDYNHQEELTSSLNFGQVVAGLLSLAPGGNLVTKQYTFFTPFSRSLIALMACHFERLYVTKPATSRTLNSEVYIVGKRFLGISQGITDSLLAWLQKYHDITSTAPAGTPPPPLSTYGPLVSEAVLDRANAELREAARKIHYYQQVDYIKEAMDLYRLEQQRKLKLRAALSGLARSIQRRWMDRYNPGYLHPDHHISLHNPYEGSSSNGPETSTQPAPGQAGPDGATTNSHNTNGELSVPASTGILEQSTTNPDPGPAASANPTEPEPADLPPR